MAKAAKNGVKLNYKSELRLLDEKGPERLYLIWGPEDYLREQYVARLKAVCIPDGENGFCFKRLNGPELDSTELQRAIDAVPFMAERTFVEIRGADINKLENSDKVTKILADIPEYCTAAFIQNAQYEPDGRLKFIKSLRSAAKELEFTAQPQGALVDWIVRRFKAAGKSVELEAVQRLLFISGDIMSGLIPEIEKVAAYAQGETVTVSDVEAVANHIPEADIFEMTELISQKKYNAVAGVLSELLANKNSEPIPMLAMLGIQMRRLYAARLAIDGGLGTKYVMDTCALKYDFIARKLLQAAQGYSLGRLTKACKLCAETDFRMKSSSTAESELLKEVVLRIAAGESDE